MKRFGYPENCTLCSNNKSTDVLISLQVEPFFKESENFKLMLIGQDPTIFENKDRVKKVLMLDEQNGQLRRWLEQIFSKDKFDSFTVYATNLVKCSFPKPPSTYKGKHFLKPYFDNCKNHLENEVINFKPNLVLTFGEPAHRYFSSMFDNKNEIKDSMKLAFGNKEEFFRAKIKGLEFSYSPSLHIKTFRVAETYGGKIEKFKISLKKEITKNNNT
ncbi:MAG: uracil-DNA glycosylase family protein [Draconibacterium sp.]